MNEELDNSSLETEAPISGFFPSESAEQQPETHEPEDSSAQYNPRAEAPIEKPAKMEVKLDKETIDLIRSTGQPVPEKRQSESKEAYYKRVMDIVQPYAVDNDTASFLLNRQPDEIDAESVQRLQQFVNKIVQNASGLAQYKLQNELAQIKGQVQPMAQSYQQNYQNQVAGEFLSKYDHLQNYTPLLQLSISQLQQEGFNGQPDEVYAKVAERAEQLAASMGIQLTKRQISNQTSKPQTPQQAVPTMATMSRGGRTASSGDTNTGGVQFIDPWRKKPINA